jgi:hypothetical protein
MKLSQAFLLLALLAVQTGGAAIITVTNVADNGAGTLRTALAHASNGDTILFSLPKPATIMLTSGKLLVSRTVTLLGPGPNDLAVDGNRASVVLDIAPSNTVAISGLTITNGDSTFGGGINNQDSDLIISNCIVTGNSALFGGGIQNLAVVGSANVKIVNSTMNGNSAGNSGGAISNVGEGSGNAEVQVINSTLSSNSVGNVGGAISTAGEGPGDTIIRIINSTVSGNFAGNFGGAIVNVCQSGGNTDTHIANSTFSDNASISSFGGAIVNLHQGGGSAKIELASTILNADASNKNIFSDSGGITSLGYNLSSDAGAGFLTNATDQINTAPRLGPLQDNGGRTFTHAFTCRSPAIDHGKNFSGSTNDQRGVGFARAFDDPAAANANGGDGTDIGAFEAQQPLPVCDNPPVADASATVPLVISPNGTNAGVILDDSRSYDPDGDALLYAWSEGGIPLPTGVVAVTILPMGTHSITLVVSDGTLSATNSVSVEVITEAEAVNRLVAGLSSSPGNVQSLAAALRAALASIDRSHPTAAINQLLAFQNQVRAQVAPLDAALAASLIQSAEEIIDALTDGNTNAGGRPHGRFISVARQSNGHVRMQFSAGGVGPYLIEASTNLVDWELVGVAGLRTDGAYEFEDSQATRHSSRFYRVREP